MVTPPKTGGRTDDSHVYMMELPMKSLVARFVKDESGATFPGIDANSQYLVGMTWPEGTNPAPWFLTELVPCP